MKNFVLIGYLFVFIQLNGCVKYEKKDLAPHQIFNEIEELRKSSSAQVKGSLSFVNSAEIMSNQNLQLKKIKSEYETFLKLAEKRTPLPNPNIEAGADFASPISSLLKNAAPFVAIGFTIPLGGKLKKNDELNRAKANRAFAEIQIQHRKLYLQLRESFISLITIKQKKILQEKIISSTNLLEKTLHLLRESGGVDLLEIGILELNNQQTKVSQFDLDLEYQEKLSDFSVLLNVENSLAENINISELPLVKVTPDFESLKETMIENHFQLAIQRFDYEVAEKALRLEISKQFPDISLGGSHEQEVSDKSKIIGLRVGVDLPIFDRNQHGISQAFNEREVIRKAYEQTVSESLSVLKKTFDQLNIQITKNKYIEEILLKKAEQNLNIVEKNLKVGAVDILRYLEVVRSHQEISILALESKKELLQTWLHLEETIGKPILLFPNEGEFNLPLIEVEAEVKK